MPSNEASRLLPPTASQAVSIGDLFITKTIRHCLTHVKALPHNGSVISNKAMLTGKELGAAIKAAIKKKGVTNADVARHFGIKPPSVQGWINTGRIGKDRLPELWSYFSDVVGPEHWGMSSAPALAYHSAALEGPKKQQSVEEPTPAYVAPSLATSVAMRFDRLDPDLQQDLVTFLDFLETKQASRKPRQANGN